MVSITEHAGGCVVAVRAQPGARRSGVQGEHGGALKVAVTAPAQDGRANKAIVDTVRQALALKRSQVDLLGGETSRNKKLLIRGLSRSELEARIAALLVD